MSFKTFNLFKISKKFQIIKYSLGSKLINSVSKGLRDAYDIANKLSKYDMQLRKNGNFIEIIHMCNHSEYKILALPDSSDFKVVEQIFINQEYKTLNEIFEKINLIPKLMIDAGANVGCTSIYFSSYYPDMKIIALEPNKSTYNRLIKNIEINKLNNVISLQKGVWNINTFVKADFNFRDGQDWSFRLVEAQSKEIALFEVTTITELLKIEESDFLDFLKMDIEGGEVEVFKGELNWLNKVKVIAIEIHDEFDCREAIEGALLKHGFKLVHSGELTIGVNQFLCKVSYL